MRNIPGHIGMSADIILVVVRVLLNNKTLINWTENVLKGTASQDFIGLKKSSERVELTLGITKM